MKHLSSYVVMQIPSVTGFDVVDLNLDKEGFLRELTDWNDEVAQILAGNEGIELTDDNW